LTELQDGANASRNRERAPILVFTGNERAATTLMDTNALPLRQIATKHERKKTKTINRSVLEIPKNSHSVRDL